uniref:Uncharacterized protein n=2 Tax=Panagrolaimus sp. JU765 TaxID=591449 RepID=A0AC34Q060_9BILA
MSSPYKQQYVKLHHIDSAERFCDVFGVLLNVEHRSGFSELTGRPQDEFRLKLTNNLRKHPGLVTLFADAGAIPPTFFKIQNLFKICGIPVKKFKYRDEFYLSGRVNHNVSLMILNVEGRKTTILYQSRPNLSLTRVDCRVIKNCLMRIIDKMNANSQDSFDDSSHCSEISQPLIEVTSQTQCIPETQENVIQQVTNVAVDQAVNEDRNENASNVVSNQPLPTFQFANTIQVDNNAPTAQKSPIDNIAPTAQKSPSFVDKLIGKSNPIAIAMEARRRELSQRSQDSQSQDGFSTQTSTECFETANELDTTIDDVESSEIISKSVATQLNTTIDDVESSEIHSKSVATQFDVSFSTNSPAKKRKYSLNEVGIQAASCMNVKTTGCQTDDLSEEEESQLLKTIGIQVGLPVKTKDKATQTDRELLKRKKKRTVVAESQTIRFDQEIPPTNLNGFSAESIGRAFSQFVNVWLNSSQPQHKRRKV